MSRESKVITISLPKELAAEFNSMASNNHMTKSELFRSLLQSTSGKTPANNKPDIAGNLQKYWELKESGHPTVLIGSVIAANEKNQIIILQRAEEDKHIKNLSWTFPGTELHSLEFGAEISKEMQKKIGIKLENVHIIGARVIPESMSADLTVVSLYFGANFKSSKSIKIDKGNYSSFKLLKPLDVYSYFTTSTSDEINRYLVSLSQ
jgi:hypothetical protein